VKTLAKLRKVKSQGGRLPATKRPRQQQGGMGGAMGAPGGLGGGAGGTFGGRAATPKACVAPNASAAPRDELLQGVQGINRGNQSKQSGKLQEMYKKGKGGVEAGEAF
jgi:hypothetical protein